MLHADTTTAPYCSIPGPHLQTEEAKQEFAQANASLTAANAALVSEKSKTADLRTLNAQQESDISASQARLEAELVRRQDAVSRLAQAQEVCSPPSSIHR